jgi:hypothetical protein
MSKSINYETKVKNTKDASIVFGHIHEDQVKSSLLLHGQKAKDYITMDQTAPREGWISSRCRGRYQVVSGDLIPKGQPAMYFDAKSGDIVIKTKGRIRMEAENIDIIAKGSDNKNGNVTIDGNESVNLISRKVDITADELFNVISDGTVQMTAINIMKTYANTFEKLSGVGDKLLGTTSFSTSIDTSKFEG